MPSALARLAAAARNFLARRTASGGGTASRARGGLGPAARRSARRGAPRRITAPGPAPPPVAVEQFLRQLEQATGQPVGPQEAQEVARAMAGIAPPPIEGPPPPPQGAAGDSEDEAYDEIQILGRDFGYDEDDMRMLEEGQTRVASSNVYAYYYQPETRFAGILYVTFLAPAPKGQPRTAPGPTYAYYDITRGKYERFRREADGSPGGAVWDHLRVRGTLWDHQHRYRLITVAGEYIPRRATFRGFRTRHLPPIGPPGTGGRIGRLREPGRARADEEGRTTRLSPQAARELRRRGFRRSTLEEQLFDARPDRGSPDRGTPNRGR